MEKIITDDGSITFRHVDLLEPYHTKAGAVIEAFEKHARALKVWEKESPVIFDVCSGLAYSAACALEEIRNHNNNSLVTIYLFENDRAIFEKILELPKIITYTENGVTKELTQYHHFKNAAQSYLDDHKSVYEVDNLIIIIVFGDAKKTLRAVPNRAHFVFYAPFSLRTTPDMWTKEVFDSLFDRMHSQAKLSTYAYARSIRDNLSSAGFSVEKGPILGRRSPSTIAIKQGMGFIKHT